MNFNPISRIIALALASASLYAALGAFHPGFASQVAAPGPTLTAGSERLESLSPANDSWICPMHPEIHNHAPGKCPVCKMKLVKARPKNV